MSSPTSASQSSAPADLHPTSDDDHQGKQQCPCCLEHKPPGQFTKFASCPTKPCNKTCKFCWTKHVKVQVIEQPFQPVACFDCLTPLTLDDIKKCFTKHDRDYYEWKVRTSEGQRPCSRVSASEDPTTRACRGTQNKIEGLATCNICSAQDCISCNSPEHVGEICTEYQSRLQHEHGIDETATLSAFQHGYTATEEIGKQGNHGQKQKYPVPCPGYGVHIERMEKCPLVRCLFGNMEFCTRPSCGATYLGKGSVAEMGNAAHAQSCAHSKRQRENRRFKQGPKKGKAREDGDEDAEGEEGEGGQRNKRKASSNDGDDESLSLAKKRKPVSKDRIVDSDGEDVADTNPEQSAEDSSPKPPKTSKRGGKNAAGAATGAAAVSPETKAKRQKAALRREKRKGIEQKKREMQNPSAGMLAAWEEQFGSGAT